MFEHVILPRILFRSVTAHTTKISDLEACVCRTSSNEYYSSISWKDPRKSWLRFSGLGQRLAIWPDCLQRKHSVLCAQWKILYSVSSNEIMVDDCNSKFSEAT